MHWTRKDLVFVFLSVSASRDSDHRNYSFRLKFDKHVLYKTSCIVLGVHRPNSTRTEINKTAMAYRVKCACILVYLCVTRQQSQKLSDSYEIWQKCLCVTQNYLYNFWCTLLKQRVHRETQKYLNTVPPMEGNSLKSVLTWTLRIKLNEIYIRYSDALYNILFKK